MAQAPSTKKTAKAPVKSAAKAVTAPAVSKTVAPKKTKKIANKPFAQGTGRRKASVARVLLRKGNGQIVINGRPVQEYFTVGTALAASQASFNMFPMTSGMMADVSITGGGYAAQAVAAQLGIARALLAFDEKLKPELRKNGFLTVDSRVKERKKYGQKAARAKFQFTKR